MRCLVFVFFMISIFYGCSDSKHTTAETEPQKLVYEPTWESLKKHNASPEWLKDAKFGIYFHWGVYSVPAYGNEWYARHMYVPGRKEFDYHKANYGDQSEFGYHHFIPKFTAENFNAEEWARIFKNAGARFAGPVAQHHDGFAMWDSEVNPWNSVDMGPKKDITGALSKALKKNDLKLITTFHHAKNNQRNRDNPKKWDSWDSHFPYNPKWHTSSEDPKLSKLYGMIPEKDFDQYWFDQVKEVIDQYNPDMIWFDTWFNSIDTKKVQEMSSYYYNQANDKKQDVTIGYKQADLPKEVGIKDIEQGGRRELGERLWMTDITLSNKSWCYVQGQTYKSPDLVIRNMIDVFSKNGVVLLNISPMANGSIPEEQLTVLKEIGAWMKTHAEAIYETRPYTLFGFGPAIAEDGHFGGQSATVSYTAEDVRFTQSKDGKTVYLFMLGKPKPGEVVNLPLFSKRRYLPGSPIKRITILGYDDEVKYDSSSYKDFFLTIPEHGGNDIATVFKIELD
ncbi:alpha-L-fucosidase [Croceitalea marina]|uniref:alpha-L-fucosidase n=1 Tax=Croceitalea marina TaxID=1775166 RepID=A0ABW5MVD4_9FLAO